MGHGRSGFQEIRRRTNEMLAKWNSELSRGCGANIERIREINLLGPGSAC